MTNLGAAYLQNAEFLFANNELTVPPYKAVPDH